MANKKLVILAATLAALVVMTHATFQTTVITTEVETEDELSNQGMGQCRRQLRGMWPDHCEQFMMHQGMGRRIIRDDEPNPQRGGRQFEQCCDELKMMDPQCQCEAMKMMMKQMRGMGGQMMEMAMGLPMMCGTMHHKCRMSSM